MRYDNGRMTSRRAVKRAVRSVLEAEDFETAAKEMLELPSKSLCTPLIASISSGDETIKFRAVSALGQVVARLANEDIEAARNIVRRLNWSLTEEAGAIGWGAPEAIGEILARHEGLAREFAGVLLSYVQEVNLLDHPPLLCGALRGIARLAESNPRVLVGMYASSDVRKHLDAENAEVRAAARRALDALDSDATV